MRNLINKIMMESDFEWADEFIGGDYFYSKAMAFVPYNNDDRYIILFEKGLNDDEARILLDIIRSKGWKTATNHDGDYTRIKSIVNYSERDNGYINLKDEYISYGYSIDTFNSVNTVNWEDVPKIKI